MLQEELAMILCGCGKDVPDDIIAEAIASNRSLRCSACGQRTAPNDPILKAVDGRTKFNGSDYDPKYDQDRLSKQIGRVYSAMIDGGWRTLEEINSITGDPPASISAQLRHLRKVRFGSYTVEKRHRGERKLGLYEYRLLKPAGRARS